MAAAESEVFAATGWWFSLAIWVTVAALQASALRESYGPRLPRVPR